MPGKSKSPLAVEQTDDLWYCALRKIRTFLEEVQGSEEFFRPSVVLVVNMNTGLLLALEIVREPVSPQELHKILVKAMLKPTKQSGASAHRPLEIHFEDKALVEALQPLLAKEQVAARFQPQREAVDALMLELQKQVFGDEEDEIPGLLKQRGVKPEQVGSLFSAAAAFYRAEPWIELTNDDILAVQVDAQKSPTYVIVMGNGGEEYGLSLFRNWREVETFYKASDPVTAIPREGRPVLLFNSPPFLSFDDLDAIEAYGWELPAPDLVPMPSVYYPNGLKRPTAAMLHWYEAALRAIPAFVTEHLKTSPDGTHAPVEATLTVETYKGVKQVHIRYPGGDLTPLLYSLERGLVSADDLLDEFDEEDVEIQPAFPGMFGMERVLDQMAEGMGAVSPVNDPALKKAQLIIYDAWEEGSSTRRIALAKKALQISPNCADAHLLLAAEEKQSLIQALERYQAAVEAGRRALGDDFFTDPENLGHFWGILETRPFMRAMEGLASFLWSIGETEKAEPFYLEMLRLNPGDNQGIRYLLLQLRLEMGQDNKARALLADYEGDWSADWVYTKALLAFREKGNTPDAKLALKNALAVNSYVPDYLTGKKRIPSERSNTISMGGEDEAVLYAAGFLNHWRKTPGAVDWLRSNAKKRK